MTDLQITDDEVVDYWGALSYNRFRHLGEAKGMLLAELATGRLSANRIRRELEAFSDDELWDVVVLAVNTMSKIGLDGMKRRQCEAN